MSYILLKKLYQPGVCKPYSTVGESDNMDDIITQFKYQINRGCPPTDLMIVKDMPYEFMCVVKFKGEV